MNRKLLITLATSLVATAAVVALLWAFHSSIAAASSAAASLALLQPAAPPIPPSISYQGRLTDPSGAPVSDGTYDMTFSVYDNPSSGSPLWTQTIPVSVTNGLFDVVLGSPANPLDSDAFSGGPRWLGIQVAPDPSEMMPRQFLSSVPYALTAETLRAGGQVSGTTAGPVYTFVNAGPGPALVTRGDVHVAGDLSWYTRTGHISVSPSAFQPFSESYQYNRTGRRLYTDSGEHYYAPLNLPSDSTVTNMTFYYRNATASEVVTMTLKRGTVGTTDTDDMATVGSTYISGDGYGNDYDDTIDYAQIDNEAYTYWLYAKFDGTGDDLRVMAVVIEYEYTEPY
jgi:hypothetical protein